MLRPGAKRSVVNRFPQGQVQRFRFPQPVVEVDTRHKYAQKKVNLVSTRKFNRSVTMRPEELFVGTLKLF